MSKIFAEVPFRRISGFYYTQNKQYGFSEFAKSYYKWSRVVHLHCKPYKFCPLVWGTACNLIQHVYAFLITRLLVHHKNKSNSLESMLWKDISQFCCLNLWPWRLKRNSSWEIGFQSTIFVFVNQPEVWWWEQHKHMTPRATFYPKPETNFTGFNTAHLRLCPAFKMASWSSKRRILLAWRTEETAPYISLKIPDSFSRIIFRGPSRWLQ